MRGPRPTNLAPMSERSLGGGWTVPVTVTPVTHRGSVGEME